MSSKKKKSSTKIEVADDKLTKGTKRKSSKENVDAPTKKRKVVSSKKTSPPEDKKGKAIKPATKNPTKFSNDRKKNGHIENKSILKEEKVATDQVLSEVKKETPAVKQETDDIKDIDNKTPVVSTKKSKQKKEKDVPVPRPLKYEDLGQGPDPLPSTGKMYVGCHVSAAGGVHNAFEYATECQAKSFALFLRNQRQWLAKALDDKVVEKWKEALKEKGLAPHLILPHGSYLMNLGSPKPEILEKSRNMFVEEMKRCEILGIPHYNFHPGSTTGGCSREESCKTIAESINMTLAQTKNVVAVLENMSCQGYTIGGDLHELRMIIEHVNDKTRVGVCLDTCHAHAAGYDLGTKTGFESLLNDFEKIIGWQFLRALHINDSKGKAGDHLDRHENIGKGTIGKEGFHRIMNCSYFKEIPLILETPWTDNAGYAKEIKILENLIDK